MEPKIEATHKVGPLRDAERTMTSHASLLFTWGEGTRAVALREGQSKVIGRSEPADWVIDDRSLSRAHARLSMRDARIVVQDLGSTNGCLLNGTLVQEAFVGESDSVQLGTVELRICAQTGLQTQVRSSSHATFMLALDDELARARTFGRFASVIALRHDASRAADIAVQNALKRIDRLCDYSATLKLVLLPEQDAEQTKRWIESVAWPSKLESRSGFAVYPSLACNAEELVARALDACHFATSGSPREAKPCAPEVAHGPLVRSAAMQRLYALAARAARTTLPVLIQGETGSGKELVARSVHDQSLRADGTFKAINCATLPVNLLESVLFGHERGAFTGADRQAQGVFEQAQGGTVFLDEVGELSPHAQAALLRVLEQRKVLRLGGTREIDVDARVVAATHRDLMAMVRAGSFREDLLFRLDALTLMVPPLRERCDEVLPLAELFLSRAKLQWGVSASLISEDARDALLTYAWPGNVRQLKNVIERAAVVCTGAQIELEDLPGQLWAEGGQHPPQVSGASASPKDALIRSLTDQVREFEITLIRAALEKADWNLAHAARLLGVPRRTLSNKVHGYGLLEPSAATSVKRS